MEVSGRATIELASLKKEERRKKKEEQKSIFDRVWFGEKTAVLEGAATYSSSISHIENDYYTYKT